MDRVFAIGEFFILQSIIGWPVLVPASLCFGLCLHRIARARISTLVASTALTWSVSVVLAMLIWAGLYPISAKLPGPMLSFFHIPALISALATFPLAWWWFGSNKAFKVRRESLRSPALPPP